MKAIERHKHIVRLTYSALCLALGIVLPYLTGNIPEIGQALCPMHLPVFLCGFTCGWPYGLVVGFITPILRSLIAGMPPMFPGAVGMAFELATYGCLSGLLYRLFPKKIPFLYATLLISMIAGRIVWGAARFVLAGFSATKFPFSAFIAGAITGSIPGIILQIVLIPILVFALDRARLIPEGSPIPMRKIAQKN